METDLQVLVRYVSTVLDHLEEIVNEPDKVLCCVGQIRHRLAVEYPKCTWPKEEKK